MRAIYIDESASPDGREYYLGGLVVDAPALQHIENDLGKIAEMVSKNVAGVAPDIEIHAHEVFHGKAQWKRVPLALRVKVCESSARVLANS